MASCSVVKRIESKVLVYELGQSNYDSAFDHELGQPREA